MQRRSEQPNKGVTRSAMARERLGELLSAQALPGVVLTHPGSVAWATGGDLPQIDRSAAVEGAWVAVGHGRAALITTAVEQDRVRDEFQPARHGLELVSVPWYEPEAFVARACEVLESSAVGLASDGHGAFGRDLSDELTEVRLALSEPERDDLRRLGALAAGALSTALRSWRPDETTDFELQGRVAAALESGGADAPVLIVGGDERLRRYRHPLAIGARPRQMVMAVVVARRGGLHVAATRFAAAGSLDKDDLDRFSKVARIEEAVLAASVTGARYGAVLNALASAYATEGAPGAWAEHYQGGPIGYAQREFEIAPGQRDSHWYEVRVAPGHALAWNPSLAGGAKVEDTYLVTEGGLEQVTCDGEWPTRAESEDGLADRPAVLEVMA